MIDEETQMYVLMSARIERLRGALRDAAKDLLPLAYTFEVGPNREAVLRIMDRMMEHAER